MTANTPHLVFDEVASRSPVPLLSIVETCAAAAERLGLARLALLGTRFTMEASFYPEVCARYGITVIPPGDEDRAWIHERYLSELLTGEFTSSTRDEFNTLVARLRDHEGIDGVVEVTLLGQNVNSYGVEFGDRFAFGKLLRACGEIEGLERVRFTSPHPAAFTDDVIAAMAETPNVMPQLHMPLQSGSDKVLKDMRRSYRQSRFLGIIDRVRAAMPEAAITTDIIVGFPGETEEDFLETMKVVEQARFSGAFTFQYSKRPGTPAAVLEDQVPRAVVQDRYERLVALVNDIAWDENKKIVGRTVELLVSEGEGRKDAATHRLTGRARDNRLVHFTAVDHDGRPVDVRPGDMVEVEVTYGAPHHLVSDAAVRSVRRTRAGDAWEARNATPAQAPGVLLGLPTVGVPESLPATGGGCSL